MTIIERVKRWWWGGGERAATAEGWHAEAVVVHQFGKVGSSTLDEALRSLRRWPVYQTHVLRPGHRFLTRDQPRPPRGRPDLPPHAVRSREVWERYVEPGRPIAVITPVREPVSRNISAFFQNLYRHPELDPSRRSTDVDAYVQAFLAELDPTQPGAWFERQYEPAFGVNVYDHPFDAERGWGVIDAGRRRYLLLQCELDDAVKAQAVCSLLDLPRLTLKPRNVGDSKDYARVYAAFKRRLMLPREYLDAVLTTRYATHFYSDEQREAVRRRWAGERGAT